MDILYIIGNGSECDNFELRCSLRSVEKYGKNVGKIYVVGYCPDWLSDNVIKIPHEDTIGKRKEVNILSALLYAIDHSDIGEEFLISSDDHYLLKPVDFDNYPFYAKLYITRSCRHMLPERVEPQWPGKTYARTLANTCKLCKDHNLSTFNFTLHRNMHCSRKIVEECRSILNEIIENNLDVESKAFLLNYWFTRYPFDFKITRDLKISSAFRWYKLSNNPDCFSTANFSNGSDLYLRMNALYSEKSKYEI